MWGNINKKIWFRNIFIEYIFIYLTVTELKVDEWWQRLVLNLNDLYFVRQTDVKVENVNHS